MKASVITATGILVASTAGAITPAVDQVAPAASEGARTILHYWHSPDRAWAAETPKGHFSGLENPTRRDYFSLALPVGATTNDAPKGRALVVLLHGRNGGRFMDGSMSCIGGATNPDSVFYAPPDAYAMGCDSLANLLSDYWYGALPPPRTIYSDAVGNLSCAGDLLKPVGGHHGACDAKSLGMTVLGGEGPEYYLKSDCTHWGQYIYVGFRWGFMDGDMFKGPCREPWRTYHSDPSMTCLKWNLSHENAVVKRILAEIEWVVSTYGIDRDRIYLVGNSMGGQAALAIGMTHGEIFAAVNANVPATIWYAAARLGFVDEKGEDVSEGEFRQPAADPPPVFDWSGSNDTWSRQHDVIYRNVDRFRFPYTGWWGAFGHCGSISEARKRNPMVLKGVDFFSIRRDQPYVVFSKASCNDALPWPETDCVRDGDSRVLVVNGIEQKSGWLVRREGSPESGQWNAWLRGRVLVDAPKRLEAEVWIATEDELPAPGVKRPESATAEVVFRRLKNFPREEGLKPVSVSLRLGRREKIVLKR